MAATGLAALYLPDSNVVVAARCAALLTCGVWAVLLINNARKGDRDLVATDVGCGAGIAGNGAML